MWMSVEVVSGVRIVQCHASMDVVIGVCVMLCHQAIDNFGFSTFLNFPLRVQILILLSSCINSSSLFPVAILCTLLHCENTSFEVWYLQEDHSILKLRLVLCQSIARLLLITRNRGFRWSSRYFGLRASRAALSLSLSLLLSMWRWTLQTLVFTNFAVSGSCMLFVFPPHYSIHRHYCHTKLRVWRDRQPRPGRDRGEVLKSSHQHEKRPTAQNSTKHATNTQALSLSLSLSAQAQLRTTMRSENIRTECPKSQRRKLQVLPLRAKKKRAPNSPSHVCNIASLCAPKSAHPRLARHSIIVQNVVMTWRTGTSKLLHSATQMHVSCRATLVAHEHGLLHHLLHTLSRSFRQNRKCFHTLKHKDIHNFLTAHMHDGLFHVLHNSMNLSMIYSPLSSLSACSVTLVFICVLPTTLWCSRDSFKAVSVFPRQAPSALHLATLWQEDSLLAPIWRAWARAPTSQYHP